MSSAKEIAYIQQRQKRMPEMIESTERKLAGLYREARRYNMQTLLSNPEHINEAWDREVLVAAMEGKLDAA